MATRKHKTTPTRRGTQRKGGDADLMDKLRRYIRSNGGQFLEDPNITSIGIGYKIKDGKRTNQISLQFTVASKVEEGSALESMDTELIPKTLEVEGVEIPTDVIQRKFELSYEIVGTEEISDRKKRLDPILPGVSVCHHSGSAGTLGLVVFDRQNGDPCILSNWHVLHRATGKIGDQVVQPGPHDDNNLHLNHAGKLVRSHLGAAGDCAIARIENRDFDRNILELNLIPKQVARADLGDTVIKSGRTTSVTKGVVRRVDVLASITYPGVGSQQVGCFEIGPEEGTPPSLEISMGGDSGSAWLIANENGTPSEILAGLHFAGETSDNPDEHALACYAHSVFKKLEISLEPLAEEDLQDSEVAAGYNPDFLSTAVQIPSLSSVQIKDAFQLDGKPLIPYTHFSVILSKSRRLARVVAWNIDGDRVRRLSRRGLGFLLDPRVPREFQNGNELYRNNNLDRGHLARRADLIWGSQSEAKRANRESFFYTNIAPQHESFNQSSKGGIWGELENAVLTEVDVEDLRVSVMGGPIFREDDPVHRGVKIPREFWKLIAYTDTADGKFKVRAYQLTQRDLLTDLEALELDPFRIFQISLDRLEEETGLAVDSLKEADTFTSGVLTEAFELERVSQAREVLGLEDLIV